MSQIDRSYAIGVVLIASGALCWSTAGLIVRGVDASAWEITFWRSAFMTLALLPLLLARRAQVLADLRAAGWSMVLSGALLAATFILFILALSHTTVANALFVMACAPLLTAVLVSAVAFALADFSIAHMGLTVVFAVITAVLFALAGFINAVYANSFDHISIVPTFVLTPLTYLGGVFYSVDLLPPFWRMLSLANPVLYLVDGFRYAILGSSDIPVLNGLSLLLVLTAALGAWALWLMQRGVGIKT